MKVEPSSVCSPRSQLCNHVLPLLNGRLVLLRLPCISGVKLLFWLLDLVVHHSCRLVTVRLNV